ncbi:MAG: hypothetical protein J7L14_03530 [Candidatus Diapherotrites archaeon]|nr:hypothetical protein [Candidatus Diapherotrites archaeon]
MGMQDSVSLVLRIAVLVGLLFALLVVLTYTGIVKCSALPGWCSVYWTIFGQPKILIVYGNSGLGNPELLRDIIADPITGTGIRPVMMHISRIGLGNLNQFDLVIVERCRKMSSRQIKMFVDYALAGKRLIWTGDAGVEVSNEKELVYKDEIDENAEHIPLNPWIRKLDSEYIFLDELLGVRYIGNFCNLKNCPQGEAISVGLLVPESTREHPLIKGLATNLSLYIFPNEDFAVVELLANVPTNVVLSLDFGSNLILQSGRELGNSVPLIVTSGIGERVAYYAMPPEMFANPKLEEEKRYYSIPLKMIKGMISG